ARCPSAALFHRACPGCGLTRAILLLLRGDLGASIAMHPLAVPAALSIALLAVATVWTTLVRGTPTDLVATRLGRVAVIVLLLINVLLVPLWIARALGAFGGLPPV